MRSMILSAAVAGLLSAGGLAASGVASANAASDGMLRLAQGLGEPAAGMQEKRAAIAQELKQISETVSDLASKPLENGADPMMARRLEQEQANLSVIATRLRTEADKLSFPSTSGTEARNELEQALRKVESMQQSVRQRRTMADEAIQAAGGENSQLYRLLSSAVEALSEERVQSLRGKL